MKAAVARAKRSAMGRTLCRMCGDRSGAVMMEYVILGVLIAAAAVLAVTFFGRKIVGSFMVMDAAVSGQNDKSEAGAKALQAQTVPDAQKSEQSRGTIAPGK